MRALETDHRNAELSLRQRVIVEYAVKLTQTPGAMTQADLTPMRNAGLSDRDILDVNQVTAYFAYVNRVADGLGVGMDAYAAEEHNAIIGPTS